MARRYRGKDWLQPGGPIQPWIDALQAIDHRGNKEPLIKLLKSNEPIPQNARWYLANLLERYQLKKPVGGRATPAYDRSDAEMYLAWAKTGYLESISAGLSPEEAFELAVRLYGVNSGTFRNYLAGKHSSSRRMKKRRPPNTQP